jgi:hypothetical protein
MNYFTNFDKKQKMHNKNLRKEQFNVIDQFV